MYRTLSDLRWLRLALRVEETLERYEDYLRGLLPFPLVRAKVGPLFEEGPGHRGLKDAHRRLEKEAQSLESSMEPADILQTILDCEVMAHEFYVRNLDRLSDPSLVDLFRRLADEERSHMAFVQEAMRLLTELPGTRKLAQARR